jgi:hypothetical protein
LLFSQFTGRIRRPCWALTAEPGSGDSGAEGPIHAKRAYRLYILAAGGQRVGPDIRRTFHKAKQQALRKGLIRQLDDGITALDEKTLYVPGKPSTLVRDLGPRQLTEVPRSEVAKLIKYLRAQGAADDTI